MKIITQVDEACLLLTHGKVVAYPTEAVYGLGCDPFNKGAVEKIIALKHRSMDKGFIILIADWSQLIPLIGPVSDSLLDSVRESWPGPVTWVFPRAATIPDWLCGQHDSIAIRMSAHPIARQLCADAPVLSTSANLSNHAPAFDLAQLREQFPTGIDALLAGDLGGASQPSAIYDVRSGQRLR